MGPLASEGHALPRWELRLRADAGRGLVGRGRLLYPLAIDHGHTFEEVLQLYDMLFDC